MLHNIFIICQYNVKGTDMYYNCIHVMQNICMQQDNQLNAPAPFQNIGIYSHNTLE